MRLPALTLLLALPALSRAVQPATLLDAGFRRMYDLQFDEAHRCFREWSRQHPEDPMGPVADAAAWLFGEFDRLHILQSQLFTDDERLKQDARLAPDPEVKRHFEQALEKGRELADRAPTDSNALFASVLRFGLHADYLALIEKRYLDALSEMKSGRALAQKLLAADPRCYDAYLALGVENYLLSLKPAPVRWILRLGGAQTDKERGLRQLRITAGKGHYLMPYARLLLAVAALRDQDRPRAAALLAGLASEFPHNPLYARELARLHSGNG